MLFSSYQFIFFFAPIVISVYLLTRGGVFCKVWLLAASLVFYAFQNVKCLPVLIVSIAVNYIAGIYIMDFRRAGREKLSRSVFVLGLVFNVLLLGFFKYTGFIISTINHFGGNIQLPDIILPPGISFFTITEMIYLVDVYQGVTKDRDPLNFALFVSFFPHILAGPILWHKPIVKQLNKPDVNKINWENIARGLTLFIIGLAKKVVIADKLGRYVNNGFAYPEALTVLDGTATAFCYTLQLYFDFSGYSDMAVGLAMMMNIDIPFNFNSPYKAYGLIDYWNRWHMSLTQAITNYIYTPIVRAFSEITFGRAMFATFTAMLIAGIWHGAGWTFIIFGALHGLGLVLNHVWKKYKLWMPRPLGYVLMWGLILTANVFFRAESVRDALTVLQGMIGLRGFLLPSKLAEILGRFGITVAAGENMFSFSKIIFPASIIAAFFCPNSLQLTEKFTACKRWLIFTMFLVMTICYSFNAGSIEFIYFQF